MQVKHLDYIIESDKYGHYNIRTDGRGTVMKELRGSYTTVLKAIQDIDRIGSMRSRKVKKNGTSSSDSGDKHI